MRRLALLAVPVLVAGLLVGLPQEAGAAVGGEVCAVNEIVTYSPPITNSVQSITVAVEGRLSCRGGTAGTATFSGTHQQEGLSCNIKGSGVGAITFRWADTAMAPSVFSHTSVAVVSNGEFFLGLTGSITSGAFTPAKAKEVVIASAEPNACATNGVSRQVFTGVLAIGA